MTTQLTLNIPLARSNRDEGIQRAVDSANRKDAGWSEKAFEMFREWLSGWPPGFKFQMEDFRKVAQIKGLPDPPTARVFGSIAVRARKANLIKSNGQKATDSETAHRCYANEWEKI
jgi:hypothetical protein